MCISWLVWGQFDHETTNSTSNYSQGAASKTQLQLLCSLAYYCSRLYFCHFSPSISETVRSVTETGNTKSSSKNCTFEVNIFCFQFTATNLLVSQYLQAHWLLPCKLHAIYYWTRGFSVYIFATIFMLVTARNHRKLSWKTLFPNRWRVPRCHWLVSSPTLLGALLVISGFKAAKWSLKFRPNQSIGDIKAALPSFIYSLCSDKLCLWKQQAAAATNEIMIAVKLTMSWNLLWSQGQLRSLMIIFSL